MSTAHRRLAGLILLVATWAVSCHALAAQDPSAIAAPGRLAEFESRLDELRKTYHVPGMTGSIAFDDRIVWTKGFGQADVAANEPAGGDTVYHLASLTKPFAGVVLLQLVEEGKLDLDAPAADFGIDLPSEGVIRVWHLLTHTSEGTPGAKYRYSGDRFGQLDKVVERATGRSFAAEVSARILQPLQMIDTAPNPLDSESCADAKREAAEFARRLAQGYEPDGVKPVNYQKHFLTAAGLVSTASDVARFSMALDSDQLLPAAMRARMFTPAVSEATHKPLPYGLGWFVQKGRDAKLVWHYGWWVGSSALIIKIPERRLTFVLLANSDGLSREFNLGSDSNVARSPFARAFLTLALSNAK